MKSNKEDKNSSKASVSLLKIICVCLILLFISGIGVMAVTTKVNTVKISLSNGYEMTALTSKTKVADILKENNIVLTEEEKVIPALEENINNNNSITISNKSKQEVQIAQISEKGLEVSMDQLLKSYSPIVEKIVVEQVAIPFETVTKDISRGSKDIKNRVINEGQEGLKEVTYKVKYQNNVEIEKIPLSEVIIKNPVNKVVQVQRNVTSRASTTSRAPVKTPKDASCKSVGVYKVTGYCSCPKCCGRSSNGYTASGTKATSGRTVAASGKFAFGTKLSINGNTYVVEDRGGAIQGNKIDIYFNSHAQALAWGVKYLPVEVVNQ